MASKAQRRAIIEKGLRQINDDGLKRIVRHKGGMLLNSAVYDPNTKLG